MSEQDGFEKDIEDHLNWMRSLISGPSVDAETTQLGDYEKQIEDLMSSIQAPTASEQPRISEVCQQYTSIAKDAYGVHDSPLAASEKNEEKTKEYRISDPVDDSDYDYEDDCEEYYAVDPETIRGQEIPSWARAKNLIVELQNQQSIDPDTIFTNFDTTCNLDEMFETNKKFKNRGDSGYWEGDNFTKDEDERYKRAVGISPKKQ